MDKNFGIEDATALRGGVSRSLLTKLPRLISSPEAIFRRATYLNATSGAFGDREEIAKSL